MSLNLAFFGLQQKPFNPTPDPRFLYPSPGHREGPRPAPVRRPGAQGLHPADRRDRHRQDHAPAHASRAAWTDNCASAFVFDTTLPFEGILEYMLEDLGVAKAGETHVQRLIALNNFLIERRRAGQNTVLVLDEAQNLESRASSSRSGSSRTSRPTGEAACRFFSSDSQSFWTSWIGPELRQLKQRISSALPHSAPGRGADAGLHPHATPHRRGEQTSGSSPMRRLPASPSTPAGSRVSSIRSATTACSSATPTRSGTSIAGSSTRPSEYLEHGEQRPRTRRRRLSYLAPEAGSAGARGPQVSRCWVARAALTITHCECSCGRSLDLSTATLSGLAHAASGFLRQ